jgi:3-dehydroquinate synthase
VYESGVGDRGVNKIKVHLDKKTSSSYEIYIGTGMIERMALLFAKQRWGSRYFMITDSTVAALYGQQVQGVFTTRGLTIDMIAFPAGEAAKDIATIRSIGDQLLGLGADRTSALIALGGGVVGDIAGFVASIYMRGIPYLQIPTTLLAQVDSSIGGKTGIDLSRGKNILGTFYQPKGVFIDLAFLKTLPTSELRTGLAEVIKYGIIEDPELFGILESKAEAITSLDLDLLQEVVIRSCHIKKGIVEIDEHEKGVRRILNFGHTIGHAIEAESGYAITHGDAIAMGMVAAAIISERLHHLPAGDRERIIALIRALGLPVSIPSHLTPAGIYARLYGDKKKAGDTLHFVLLRKIGTPFVTSAVPEGLIKETIQGLLA